MERPKGRRAAEEHERRVHSRASPPQIGEDCVTDVLWQRQSHGSLALSADDDGAVCPIEIRESKLPYVSGAQREPREQEQNGAVATTLRRPPVAARDDPLDVLVGDEFRHRRQPPPGYDRNGTVQVAWALSRRDEEPHERPKGANDAG
jgi:hypothetical protein